MNEQTPTREEMREVLERVRQYAIAAFAKDKKQLAGDLLNVMWWARAAIYGRQEGHQAWIGGAE